MRQSDCVSGLNFCISEEKLMRQGLLPTQEMAVSSSSSLLFKIFFRSLPYFVMIYGLAYSLQWLWCWFCTVGKWLASKSDSVSLGLKPGQGSLPPFSLLTCELPRSPRHMRMGGPRHSPLESPFLLSLCFHFLCMPAACCCEIHPCSDEGSPCFPECILAKTSTCALH